jgi:hypothetical protein
MRYSASGERGGDMPLLSDVQRERKKTLRTLQKARRSLERNLNILERQIRQKLSKKRLIDFDDANQLKKTADEIGKQWLDVLRLLTGFGNLVRIA